MKQLLFLSVLSICFWSCSSTGGFSKDPAEQTRAKLLKQAGLDKMDKSFSYEYTLTNDAATGFLKLIPADGSISMTNDEMAKGKPLNAFIAADGKQYNTMLMKRGAAYITRIVSIDGNVFEEHEFVVMPIPPGNPPNICDDCSAKCIQNCADYYTRSVFPHWQDSANGACKTLYFRFMCPLNAKSCHADMLHVFVPESCSCGIHLDPGSILTKKMAGGLIIKDAETEKATN